MVNEDCSSAFYCSQYIEGIENGNEGCLKECGEGEIIIVDQVDFQILNMCTYE